MCRGRSRGRNFFVHWWGKGVGGQAQKTRQEYMISRLCQTICPHVRSWIMLHTSPYFRGGGRLWKNSRNMFVYRGGPSVRGSLGRCGNFISADISGQCPLAKRQISPARREKSKFSWGRKGGKMTQSPIVPCMIPGKTWQVYHSAVCTSVRKYSTTICATFAQHVVIYTNLLGRECTSSFVAVIEMRRVLFPSVFAFGFVCAQSTNVLFGGERGPQRK